MKTKGNLENMGFKMGDRVEHNSPLGYLGIGTIVGFCDSTFVVIELDRWNSRLWNCNGLVPSGRGYMSVPEFLKLVERKAKEQTEYQKDIEYIMSHATNEELDKFCGLTEKDYDNFRKHHLEQTIADVSEKTLNKFLKEIE